MTRRAVPQLTHDTYPKCPHGCGHLTDGGAEDFYVCPKCGDEWAIDGWDDSGNEVEPEPMPASGGVAFIDRRDP